MTEIPRMTSVEPVVPGVVIITWQDGFEAVVDLRPVFADGEAFEFLRRDDKRLAEVKLSDAGHSIFWLDDDGDEIDFGSEALRHRAERQAAILRLAS